MQSTGIRTVELVEHAATRFARDMLSDEDGMAILRTCRNEMEVTFPSPANGYQWQLLPAGWVGIQPVRPDLVLHVTPKLPIANLFGMLEVAYRIKGIEFGQSLHACGTLQDMYDHLAAVLAKRVLDRARIGLFRSYRRRSDHLAFVRGRIRIAESIRRPWNPNLPCHFEEHTGDIADNRILAWTLERILRSGFCRDETRRQARMAYRVLSSLTTLVPCTARDCVGRSYGRLNADYAPMHALCRFFLESAGPTHNHGSATILPFTINMPELFELFVAQWLSDHLPAGFAVTAQESVHFDGAQGLNFRIDLVLKDSFTRQPLAILDTKYKDAASPSTDDIQQVVAYAEARGCKTALLVYPKEVAMNNKFQVGSVRVISTCFPVAGSLEEGGRQLLASLKAHGVIQ